MRRPRFGWNAFGHGLGLLASLVFVGMGVVGVIRHGWPDSGDALWAMVFFMGTASVFAWQLKHDIFPRRVSRSDSERQTPCSVVFDDYKIQSFYTAIPMRLLRGKR
jgi:hypothetical protein